MKDAAAKWDSQAVITASIDEHVSGLVARLGGTPLPCLMFSLPMGA